MTETIEQLVDELIEKASYFQLTICNFGTGTTEEYLCAQEAQNVASAALLSSMTQIQQEADEIKREFSEQKQRNRGREDTLFAQVIEFRERAEKAESDFARLTQELEKEKRWIPVSERLPEIDQMVLAFGGSEDAIEVYWYTNSGEYGNGTGIGHFVLGNCCYCEDISHWRPLPQLPKAGVE